MRGRVRFLTLPCVGHAPNPLLHGPNSIGATSQMRRFLTSAEASVFTRTERLSRILRW